MKTAYIIYDKARIHTNLGFADMLISAFGEHGWDAKLAYAEGFSPERDGLPDIAVMRTVDWELSKLLEDSSVVVSNNSEVGRICNDKYLTYLLLNELGIPTMPTRLIERGSYEGLDYPAVLKSLGGHGGSEVFWVADRAELEHKMSGLNHDTAIIQSPASGLGKDLRVYVLGGKIVKGIMRTSDKDFRSNYSLGGKIQAVEVPSAVAEAALKVASTLKADLCGVDFIFHKGEPVINEIEDVVGTRMLYAATDIDIVKMYVEYLVARF